MKTFKHVTYTWLLSQLLHPLVFLVYMRPTGNGGAELFHLIVVFGFLLSIPAYIFCLFLFSLLRGAGFTTVHFILWIICVMIAIQLGCGLSVNVLFGEWNVQEILPLIIPGGIAAVLSILIRYKQFFQFKNEQAVFVEETKSDDND